MDNDDRARIVAAVRRHRARREQLTDDLASGRISLEEVLVGAAADEVVADTKLAKVLVALPEQGKVSSKRLLASLGIDGDRPVGDLSETEKEGLVAALS